MAIYAKYIDPHHVQEPHEGDFAGIPNWIRHDAMLRRRGYLPLVGEAEAREGFDAYPVEYALEADCIRVVRWDYRAAPAREPDLDDYNTALERRLLDVRWARGYTDREPSDYYNSSVERWARDARAWVAFRDAVMLFGLGVLQQYEESGVAPMSLADFEARLAAIPCEWEDE